MSLKVLSLRVICSAIAIVGAWPVSTLAIAPATSPTTVESSANFPSLAQVDPSQDRFPEEGDLPDLLPGEEPEIPPQPPAEEPPPPSADTSFRVTDIQVVGSTLFDDITLEEIVSPYENREVTLAELQEAADAITQLYLSDGYITSRAIVGTQTIVGGVVQIQVIEGELEDIEVEGTRTLQDYVRARVSLGSDRPLNQARLEDQLRLLRVDPLFDSVEASLRAGSGTGKSRLIVRVTEVFKVGGAITSDNYSPPAVGDVRFGASLDIRNLTGRGDTLFGSVSLSDTLGSRVYEVGYRIPVNPMNGTIQVRYAPNDFRITDPELLPELDTEGSTDIIEVSARQPLIRTPRNELALSLGYRYRRGSTVISDIITDATTTNVFSFGQDFIHRDVTGAWALRSQFRIGDENADEDSIASGAGGFFSWAGQAQRVQRLTPDNLLIVQGSLQLSPDTLPGSEQFFVGGGLSVRGYDQNQRFGDNGIRFSIEDQITVTRYESGLPFFQVMPFLDGGVVWFNDEDSEITDNNFLLGTGVGILVNITENLSLRTDLAYPLIDIAELSTDDPRGAQFYFSVGYRF